MQAKRNILPFPLKKSMDASHQEAALQREIVRVASGRQGSCRMHECRFPIQNRRTSKTFRTTGKLCGAVIPVMHLA